MVQLFYYENRGKCCRKLWKHDGNKLKVYLHAEESWAETALASYWMIKPSPWWIGLSQKWRGRPRKFVVEEHMGSKVRTGQAVMIDNGPQGVLWVRGAFSRKDKSILTPYFKLTLTSHVSPEDFQLGYSMTGLVERSSSKYVNFQTTHLAFVRRTQQQHEHHFNQDSNKNNHLNSFLTNLELSKMFPNTYHSTMLDNQFQSAQKLQQNLSSRRCDSTSSDSSTSTFVEDGFKNDDTSFCTQKDISHNNVTMVNQHEQDLILVLPFSNTNVFEEGENQVTASKNKLSSSSSSKKCCSVQCIDSMSTSSSVCPPCPAPISNCFKRSPLPFRKDKPSSIEHDDEWKETMQKKKPSSRHSLTKANFTHLIRIPTISSSPYKGISEDTKTCKYSSNKVQIPNSRVHQLLRSPFKEWLL